MHIGLSRCMQMQIRLPVVLRSVRFMQMAMMMWARVAGCFSFPSRPFHSRFDLLRRGSLDPLVAVFTFVPRSLWFDMDRSFL